MPTFSYKAKKGPEDIVEGVMDADSVEAVVEKLNAAGYVPFLVEEGGSSRGIEKGWGFSKKIRSRDINIFTRQLSNLLKSRVTLIKALRIIHEQTENIQFKDILRQMLETVKEGGNISDVLERYPRHFSNFYINNVRSGELGCVLEESLERLGEFSDKDEELKTKVRIALAYPLFMLFTGILTIIVLLTFVMPKLAGMFDDMGDSLPLPTQIIINISSGIRNYWYVILIGGAALYFFFKRRGLSSTERHAIDRIKLTLPVIGRFLRQLEIARFARTLSLLMDNGVALHKAIETAVPTLSNVIIQQELSRVGERVVGGLSFSRSLENCRFFPPFVISMITVGEEGGTLGRSLNDIADYYEREGDQAMKIISSMIEPAMILGMGIIVGFIVISMLLPIFELNVIAGG